MSVYGEFLSFQFGAIHSLDGLVSVFDFLELDVSEASAGAIGIAFQFAWHNIAILSEGVVKLLLSDVFVNVLY